MPKPNTKPKPQTTPEKRNRNFTPKTFEEWVKVIGGALLTLITVLQYAANAYYAVQSRQPPPAPPVMSSEVARMK